MTFIEMQQRERDLADAQHILNKLAMFEVPTQGYGWGVLKRAEKYLQGQVEMATQAICYYFEAAS